MQRIAKQNEVSLATFVETPEEAASVRHLREFCQCVETVNLQRHHAISHLPGLLRYALAGKPFEHKFYYSKELVQKIRNLASTIDFDIVQIEKEWMAQYLETLPAGARCKSIFMSHNFTSDQYKLIFRIEHRPVMKMRALLYSWMERAWEQHYLERFDRCTTVSEADRRLYLKASPRLQIDVIPNGVDTQMYRPLPQEDTFPSLLFIGNMGYPPCADAALYFCHKILPLIQRTVAELDVWIVGRDPSSKIMQLASDKVHVTGRVDDIIPYYRRSTISIVPLRAGGGTRLKILEAMALGRAVVTTRIGCEGLDVVGGEHLLVADNPQDFADCTIRLLRDKAFYKRIATSARELVASRYDWDEIARKLQKIYTQIVE
jgi:glycosyltransferase involved in cell wall biosynthesis